MHQMALDNKAIENRLYINKFLRIFIKLQQNVT